MSGIYVSGGGGTGGCEDPRLTRIGDHVYMTYVAYDGHSHPRVALSSIHIDDFSIESGIGRNRFLFLLLTSWTKMLVFYRKK